MSAQEGVIKFQLKFTEAPPLPFESIRDVNAWRRLLFLTGLIGQNPERYGGFGYGNLSRRVEAPDPSAAGRFVISGTQTGHIPHLSEEHYSLVLHCRPEENQVVAQGPVAPSSEALTHGVLYASDHQIGAVMHVHSPDIWRDARSLGLRVTAEEASYGSLELVESVRQMLLDPEVRRERIFAMGGHEDGIISFGATLGEAGMILMDYLVRAFRQ